MICKKCGTDNGTNVGKCKKCGASLSVKQKTGQGILEISPASVVIILFSLLAVICLILPGSRTVSIIETVTHPGTKELDYFETIKKDMSIANERDKIDANIQSGKINTKEAVYNGDFTAQEAIRLLNDLKEKNKASDDVDEMISHISQLDSEATAQQKKVDKLSKEDADVNYEIKQLEETIGKIKSGEIKAGEGGVPDINTAEKKLDELKSKESGISSDIRKNTDTLNELNTKLESYIHESIYKQDLDEIDLGALGGVVREHNELQPVLEVVVLVLAILCLISFVLTIAAWVSRMYLLRLITVFADFLLTLCMFFVPLFMWTIEYKWSFEISNPVTYGINFGTEYIFVLIAAAGVLIACMAYISNNFTKTKQ